MPTRVRLRQHIRKTRSSVVPNAPIVQGKAAIKEMSRRKCSHIRNGWQHLHIEMLEVEEAGAWAYEVGRFTGTCAGWLRPECGQVRRHLAASAGWHRGRRTAQSSTGMFRHRARRSSHALGNPDAARRAHDRDDQAAAAHRQIELADVRQKVEGRAGADELASRLTGHLSDERCRSRWTRG